MIDTTFPDFQKFLPFLSVDDLRPSLTGLYIECDGTNINFVGTNGWIMIEQRFNVDKTKPFSFILSRDDVEELIKFQKNIFKKSKIHVYPGSVSSKQIKIGKYTLDITPLDENYPDYKQLLGDKTQHVIKIPFGFTSGMLSLIKPKKNDDVELFVGENGLESFVRINDTPTYNDVLIHNTGPHYFNFNMERLNTILQFHPELSSFYHTLHYNKNDQKLIYKPNDDTTILIMPILRPRY